MKAHKVLFCCLAVAAGARPAWALDLEGSDSLSELIKEVLVSCPGAAGTRTLGGGADRGEQTLLDLRQQVAPMARFLSAARTCQAPHPEAAEGKLVALDAVALVAATGSPPTCNPGGLAHALVDVTDRNGVADLQCPGCAGETYQVADWRDGLRVLYTGMHHDAGADLTKQDCNSDVRHSLVATWDSVFGVACSTGACPEIRHAFRPADRSSQAELLLSLLSIGEGPLNAYCNGAGAPAFPYPVTGALALSDSLDADPIRRPCAATEQVCGRSGTLGLVTVIDVPALAPGELFPLACTPGKFKLLLPATNPFLICPNGKGLLLGKCFLPYRDNGDGTFDANCMAPRTPVQGLAANGMDGRAYNQWIKDSAGRIRKDAQGRFLTDAFFRLHQNTPLAPTATACQRGTSAEQIGCLVQASPCSLGVGGLGAAALTGVQALPVDGIVPTVTSVQRVVANPADPLAYPLSGRMYLNTMLGYGALTDFASGSLAGCMASDSLMTNAAHKVGLVPLGVAPPCVDFDERQCGVAVFNKNACMKRLFDLCPVIDSLVVSPLQTSVGGTISVAGSGSDSDGDSLDYLWTTTAGTFADKNAAATTYTCTAPGPQIINLTIWDGRCAEPAQVLVNCLAM